MKEEERKEDGGIFCVCVWVKPVQRLPCLWIPWCVLMCACVYMFFSYLSPPAISVSSPVVVVVNWPRVTRKHTFRFMIIKWLLRDNLIFLMKLPFFLSLRGMSHWNTAGPSYTLKENKDEPHRIEPSLKLETVAMFFWYLWAKFYKLLIMWG